MGTIEGDGVAVVFRAADRLMGDQRPIGAGITFCGVVRAALNVEAHKAGQGWEIYREMDEASVLRKMSTNFIGNLRQQS